MTPGNGVFRKGILNIQPQRMTMAIRAIKTPMYWDMRVRARTGL
jgi:hypothetical protein